MIAGKLYVLALALSATALPARQAAEGVRRNEQLGQAMPLLAAGDPAAPASISTRRSPLAPTT
jgi:hypothetical protein